MRRPDIITGMPTPHTEHVGHAGTDTAVRRTARLIHRLLKPLALVLIWYVGVILGGAAVASYFITDDTFGSDAHAYWLALQNELTYDRAPGEGDAYLYSPAFRLALIPLAKLPWPFFLLVWMGLEVAILIWLVKPLPKIWALPLFLCCMPEIVVGNINILLAAAAVIGMQRPIFWTFPILTKVALGIGLTWFVFQGNWKALLRGAGGAALIVAILYLIDPQPWSAWIQFLFAHTDGTEDGRSYFIARCALALLLVAYGARRHKAWLIAPAMVLASPIVFNWTSLALLASIPRLHLAFHINTKRSTEMGAEIAD